MVSTSQAVAQGDVQFQSVTAGEVVNAITMGPGRSFHLLDPGATTVVSIVLVNNTDHARSLRFVVEDFDTSERIDGSVRYYDRRIGGPYPASSWIEFPSETIVIPSHQRASIPVSVHVPETADSGDHQAALIAELTDAIDGAIGVNVVPRLASQFVITVAGAVDPRGAVTGFSVPPIVIGPAVTMMLRGENTGTVHIAPVGTITVRNIFGSILDEIDVSDWFLLRGGHGQREIQWNALFGLGLYTATADLTLETVMGTMSEVTLTKKFFVLPLLPALVLTVLLMGLIWLIRRYCKYPS